MFGSVAGDRGEVQITAATHAALGPPEGCLCHAERQGDPSARLDSICSHAAIRFAASISHAAPRCPTGFGLCCQMRVLGEERDLVAVCEPPFTPASLALEGRRDPEPNPGFSHQVAADLAFKREIDVPEGG
jgi:hypothetical protein